MTVYLDDPTHGWDDWIKRGPKSPQPSTPPWLTASGGLGAPPVVVFDWDESKHPRGQPDNKGQFVEGGGGTTPFDQAELHNPVLLERGMAETGVKLLGPPGTNLIKVGGLIAEDPAATLKAGVAHDIAKDMKSPTADLVAAASAGSSMPPPDVLGNPLVYVGRDNSGRIWAANEATVNYTDGRPVGPHDPEPGTEEIRTPFGVLHDFARANTPEGEVLIREQAVDNLVSRWAGTSNDSQPQSLAIQHAAEKEFGLTGTAPWDMHDELAQQTAADYFQHGAVYRDFLRTQYDHTQGFLKGEGLTELTVARGWKFTTDSYLGDPGPPQWAQHRSAAVEEVPTRPLSSWTLNPPTARTFARGDASVVTYQRVPASRVLSVPLTGVGCLEEHEVVVLGGKHEAIVTSPAYQFEHPAMAAGTETFAFDENEARDEKGRWTGDGGGTSADQLLEEWRDEGSPMSAGKHVRTEMLHTGDQLLGLDKVATGNVTHVAGPLKAGVAEDLARNMKSSTTDLVTAVRGPGDEALSHLGDPNWFFIRSADGYLSVERTAANGAPPDGPTTGLAARGDSPQAEQWLRADAASKLVSTWAGTSNDASARSLAIQQAAQDEFGLTKTAGWDVPEPLQTQVERDNLAARTAAEYQQNGAVYRDFLRTQYESTQGFLKGEGVTQLTLARGFSWADPADVPFWAAPPDAERRPGPSVDTIATRPLSSWSSNAGTATTFAADTPWGAVVLQKVPAERILSCPLTGLGCLSEREFVVLGGREQVLVARHAPRTE